MVLYASKKGSRAVRRSEKMPRYSERPANGGLFRIGYRSPGSEIGRYGSEIADSLRQIFEIFPFSGDSGRRPGSIGPWRARQCNSTLGVRIILLQNFASAEADRLQQTLIT